MGMVIGEVPIEIGLPQLAVVGQPVGALEVTEVAIAVPVVLTLTVSVALGVRQASRSRADPLNQPPRCCRCRSGFRTSPWQCT